MEEILHHLGCFYKPVVNNAAKLPASTGDPDFERTINSTLPETNIAHENPIFPGKYSQNN